MSTFLLGAGAILSQWDSQADVIIQPAEFLWVNKVQVAGAQLSGAVQASTSDTEFSRESLLDPSLSPPRYVVRKTARQKTAARVAKKVSRPVETIVQTLSAPERAPSSKYAVEVALASADATTDELAAMRGVHGAFQRGFETALNLSPYLGTEVLVTTQAAASDPPPAVVIASVKLVSTHLRKPVPLKRKSKVRSAPKAEVAQALETPVVQSDSQAAQVVKAPLPATVMAQAAQEVVAPVEYSSDAEKTSVVAIEASSQTTPEIREHEPEVTEPNSASLDMAAVLVQPQASLAEEAPSRGVALFASAPTSFAGYAVPHDYPRRADVTSATASVAAPTKMSEYSAMTTQGAACQDSAPTGWGSHPYIQALNWSDAVYDGFTEELTQESTAGEAASTGWRISKAADSLPTLHWSTVGSVPMVAHNTARLLGTLLKTPIQPQMGVVLGRLPCGWSVEFSGRAEAYLLGDDNQPIRAGQEHLAKSFIFINAAPGMHLAHLVERATGKAIALASPVMAGTTTFLELAVPTAKSINGVILDASERDTAPIANVWVEVVGQPAKRARTNAKGEFKIDGVLTVGNQPLFLQSDHQSSFTHRYRVVPEKLSNLVLFRLQKEQIETWMNQLAGGVSAESGLVVVAMPQLVQQADEALFPAILPLHDKQSLTPETYSLSPTGQLQVNTPISSEAPRFLGVQIPEGAVIAQVENKAQKVIWSELVPTGKGIVNLIGPY